MRTFIRPSICLACNLRVLVPTIPPTSLIEFTENFVDFFTMICWLVCCFGFSSPLRQYFSLYQAVSQRVGETGEKGQRRGKMSKHPLPAPSHHPATPYYDMKMCMWFWNFYVTIFDEVIACADLNFANHNLVSATSSTSFIKFIEIM